MKKIIKNLLQNQKNQKFTIDNSEKMWYYVPMIVKCQSYLYGKLVGSPNFKYTKSKQRRKVVMKKQLFILLMAVLMICSCFTACGDDKGMVAMVMKTAPTKTEYLVGEKFDPAGATVEFTYEDGTTEVKELTSDMLPTDLTFNKAGFQSIPVVYTVDGVAKIAYITVKVTDPNVSVASGLQTARNDAIGKLTAFYDSMVFVAPDGYPAIPADDESGNKIASNAKAVFDQAIADINAAGTAEEVQKIYGEAQAALMSLDNYVDWYAAKKVAEMRVEFDRDFTDKKDFISNYAECLAVTERQIARILRADNLADIDTLVAEWPDEILDADNLLTDLVDKILKLEWPVDMNTDPADDYDESNTIGLYNSILEDAMAIYATNDYMLILQFEAYLENCPGYDLTLDAENEWHQMIIATKNEAKDTYNLNDVMSDYSMRVQELLSAREEADRDGGIEDIIDAAIKDYEYGAIAAGSPEHQACKDAMVAFENWVATYNVDEINYDLVDNYETLKWLLETLEKIPDFYPDYPNDNYAVTINPQIILGVTNAELATGAETIAAFEEITGLPGWASIWVDADGDGAEEQVFLIKNYLDYGTAAKRYAQLEDAKANADAVADAEAGIVDGLNTLIGKIDSLALIKYDTSFAAIIAAQNAKVQLIAEYKLGDPTTADNFVFEGTAGPTPQNADTCKANWEAIVGTENDTKLTDSGARMDELNAAYANAYAQGGVVELINAITTVPYTLDRKDAIDDAKAAYATWKETYRIDLGKDGDTLTVNDGTTILGEAYTTMIDTEVKYLEAVAQLEVVIEAIGKFELPVVNESMNPEITEAREEFEKLVELNLDETTNGNEPTYKHLPTEYAKLVNAESGIFAIQFANFLYSKEAVIEAYRADYTTKIGGQYVRESDTNALGAAKANALALLQLFGTDAYDYTAQDAYDAIYAGVAIDDFKADAEEAVEEYCTDAEAFFKVAARYLITMESEAYVLTIYAGDTYKATELFTAEGLVPTQFAKVVILTDADVTLVGIQADEIVYGEAAATTTFAVPTLTLSGVKTALVTINVACNVVIEDVVDADSAVELVVNAAITLTVTAEQNVTIQATAAVAGTVAKDVTITTNSDVELAATNISAVVTMPADATVAPTVTLTAVEKVAVRADGDINLDNVTGATVEKSYSFGNAGDDDTANDGNWTDPT